MEKRKECKHLDIRMRSKGEPGAFSGEIENSFVEYACDIDGSSCPYTTEKWPLMGERWYDHELARSCPSFLEIEREVKPESYGRIERWKK